MRSDGPDAVPRRDVPADPARRRWDYREDRLSLHRWLAARPPSPRLTYRADVRSQRVRLRYTERWASIEESLTLAQLETARGYHGWRWLVARVLWTMRRAMRRPLTHAIGAETRR